jgi:NAD+ synthase (glutamine-hydrolysing)
VGDLTGNAARIRAGIEDAKRAGAELVLFGELALTGYPPEDLLLREHFLSDTAAALEELATQVEGIVAIVGFPEREPAGSSLALGRPAPGSAESPTMVIYNSAAVLAGGALRSIYRKVHLPNYGVFDEQRYFRAGGGGGVIEVASHTIGVTVCEDLWVPGPPASEEAGAGARLIVNISASPYHAGKGLERERLFAQRAREHDAHIAFCALVGGQDELVFDGHSFVLDRGGHTIARAAQFEEDLLVCDLDLSTTDTTTSGSATHDPAIGVVPNEPPVTLTRHAAHTSTTTTRPHAPIACVEEEVYTALMLGLHDYVEKNGFGGVVLGLSGGIDSALVACLAADALGAQRVNATVMPSPYSSTDTQTDARTLAHALGVRTHELAIEPVMDAYRHTLSEEFRGLEADLTEENLQARIRGNLLMALSNKFGWLVLTTGNKSEMSVGYTTLYGDLAGGFAVIKDVPKTLVYRLARWRNAPAHDATVTPVKSGDAPLRASRAVLVRALAPLPIPPTIIERAPSAELREDQRDEDSLPPYDVLDRILHGYVELDRSREQLIAEGLPASDVEHAARLVDLAEYKRRQAPPGIKITERAFGRDRRMPITNSYLRGR